MEYVNAKNISIIKTFVFLDQSCIFVLMSYLFTVRHFLQKRWIYLSLQIFWICVVCFFLFHYLFSHVQHLLIGTYEPKTLLLKRKYNSLSSSLPETPPFLIGHSTLSAYIIIISNFPVYFKENSMATSY